MIERILILAAAFLIVGTVLYFGITHAVKSDAYDKCIAEHGGAANQDAYARASYFCKDLIP